MRICFYFILFYFILFFLLRFIFFSIVMTSQFYLNIFMDIMEPLPINPTIMPNPYDNTKSISSNIRYLYRMIRLSLAMNDRIGSLINAYYLGYILEEKVTTPKERKKYQKILTVHYNSASVRIYNLFSIVGPQQIYRTQRTSYWMFRHIKRNEFVQLIQEAHLLIVTGTTI